MRRGELYRVRRPPGDPKPARFFVVVSRQPLIDSSCSTVICAPVFSQFHGLPSQVAVSTPEGLKHASSIHCDGLISLEKSRLTDYVGELSAGKIDELDLALAVALGLPSSPGAPIALS
jgi:mRNA interferase MazF